MPTGEWEMYSAEIEGKNALVFVRTDLIEDAPNPLLPHYFTITLRLRSRRADGFSDEEETNALWRIEDRIEAEFYKAWGGVYVGRYTFGGQRVMAYYLPLQPEPQVARRLVELCATGYEFELDCFEQPDWENYVDFLYPNAIAWQEISNEPVLENLSAHGDPLTPPRHTLHWLYFPGQMERDGFAKALKSSTLQFDVIGTLDPEGEVKQYGVCLEHQCSMDKYALLNVQVRLLRLAQEFGGEYDGFECEMLGSA
ncbi:MAG: DUF695 domain-containing protein [Planctomycetes bacterium]|nr:DUF695 domain-containing protein [Planctomycetota bacterium]